MHILCKFGPNPNFSSYRVTCGHFTKIWPILLSKILPKWQISKFQKSPRGFLPWPKRYHHFEFQANRWKKQLRKCPETIPSTDDADDDGRTDGRTDGQTRWIQYTPLPTTLGGGYNYVNSWWYISYHTLFGISDRISALGHLYQPERSDPRADIRSDIRNSMW